MNPLSKGLPFFVAGMGFCGALLGSPKGILAQNPKPAPAPKVKILLADRWPIPTPLAKDAVKLTLRGLDLEAIEKAEAILANGSPVPLKIVKKEKSGPPANREPAQAGDGQLELELPGGLAKVQSLRFYPKDKGAQFNLPWNEVIGSFQMEKEPNGGFEESQKVEGNQLILGSIAPAKDVDVFALTPPKGSKSLVLSGPKGDNLTLLRPFLMLHTAKGDLVKALEWEEGEQIEVPLTGQSTYYLSILDRLDSTSNFHHYAFRVEFR